ncbi:hypothetical protein OH492_18365 [Vibrio chagasii]|nr:hypothetical protein [Vibrio chagasii]
MAALYLAPLSTVLIEHYGILDTFKIPVSACSYDPDGFLWSTRTQARYVSEILEERPRNMDQT